MIVCPLIRSVGLKATTASSRVAMLPMFVRSLRSAQQHPLERFKIHVASSHSPGPMAVAYSRAVCG
jgi:hypothetical protein